MFKEAMRETLQEDLRVCGKMIDGLVCLACEEQHRIGSGDESPYLRQLRRDIRLLERENKTNQALLASLNEPATVGLGKT